MNEMNLFPVVILAGGLATRLRPVTETLPKALIKINDVPFVFHQLKLLRRNNIKKVVMCVGYLGEQIVDLVGNGSQFDIDVDYSFDGDTLLGTAGAIKKALSKLDDDFFVLYGDSYLDCDYAKIQEQYLHSKKMSLMTVFKNEGQWDSSNVEFKNNEILSYDKKNKTERMHYIDYGLGIFNKNAFENIASNEIIDLANLYQTLLQNKQLAAYEVHKRFYEVGSFSGIKELEQYLSIKEYI